MITKTLDIIDILGSPNIYDHTPIIIIKLKTSYLNQINTKSNGLYEVNVGKLYKKLKKRLDFIDLFVPVGWIKADKLPATMSVLFANKTIVPLTNNFTQIYKNVWIGVLDETFETKKSLGTFVGSRPGFWVPVFSKNEMISVSANEAEYNIFSDSRYGNWILDKTKFYSNNTDIDACLFYSTQGEILDNSLDIFLQIKPYASCIDNIDIDTVMKKKYRGKLLLEENNNPWFRNKQIVGDCNKLKHQHLEHFFPESTQTNDKIIFGIVVVIVILLMFRFVHRQNA